MVLFVPLEELLRLKLFSLQVRVTSVIFSKAAAMCSMKRVRYKAKNLAVKVKILEAVREGKLSCQANVRFPDFVDIDNGVAVCAVLSDNQLTNAALGNDESNVKEVPLRPIVAEVSAALLVLEDFCYFGNPDCMSHLEHLRK